MNEINHRKHSKAGIASCVIAVLTWAYLAILIFLFFFSEDFAKIFNDTFSPASNRIVDFRGFGMALLLMLFLFFVVPIAGHFTGLVFAIIGVVQQSRKKTFAIAGLILNTLIFFSGAVLYVIGSLQTNS